MIKKYLIDKKHRTPRIWSNIELKKVAHYFEGDVINVSAYMDEDKEGYIYGKDYFVKAKSYSCSNYDSEKRGFQGSLPNEHFLDLERVLDVELVGKYDLVFNHTTLEHIFNFKMAFSNLCALSKNYVILIVPFLQEQHADYGDYWRFSPTAIKLMFKEQGLETVYINYNDGSNESIYVFAIAAKIHNSILNKKIAKIDGNKVDIIDSYLIGSKIILMKKISIIYYILKIRS